MLDIRYILLHTATTSAFTTTIIMRLPPLADQQKAAVLPNSAEVRKDLWTYRILFRTWKNRELLPWHYSIGYLHILGKLANWVQLLNFHPKKCISSMIFSYFTRNYAKLDFPKEFCSAGSRWKKATTTTAEEIHLSFFFPADAKGIHGPWTTWPVAADAKNSTDRSANMHNGQCKIEKVDNKVPSQ